MVRSYNIYMVAHERIPQCLALACAAQRRRTLGQRADSVHVLFCKEQIVWTGLNRDVRAFGASFEGRCYAAARADVNNMQLHSGFGSQQRSALDGRHFRRNRARIQEVANAGTTSGNSGGRQLGDDLIILGVYCNRQLKLRGFTHSFVERLIVTAWKFGQARVRHEGLESDYAAGRQFSQSATIARNDSSPQPKVGDRRLFKRRALLVKLRRANGAWRGIEWHVKERRSAARGQSATAGSAALPISPAWLVEVDMNVNQARQHSQAAGIDFSRSSGKFGSNCTDPAFVNRNVRKNGSMRRNDSASANHQFCQRASPIALRKFKPVFNAAVTSAARTFSSG